MRCLIVFALCIVAISALNLEKEWKDFKAKYNKGYKDNTPLGRQRKQNFAENLKLIEANHQKYAEEKNKKKSAITYILNIGPFADLSYKEFKNKFKSNRVMKRDQRKCKVHNKRNYRMVQQKIIGKHRPISEKDKGKPPREVDWSKKINLGPVQNQGDTNCCWAFASIGVVEAAFTIKYGKYEKLSEQELIDCINTKLTNGCDGGMHYEAFDYILDEGVSPAVFYPRTPEVGTCAAAKMQKKKQIFGFRHLDLVNPDEEELKKVIAFIGPVVTSLPTPKSMHHYTKNGGVYNDPRCNQVESDHYVIVVGYGVEPNGQEYWLIRNSWSERWGINGYMKLARNQNNLCHIASEAFYPII